MNPFTYMDRINLLKLLLAAYEACEELEPHFTQRRDITQIKQAIKELEP